VTTVITFGTFDVLHVGHVRVLNRAAALGDRLVVGVSSDALNFSKKGRNPVFDQDERTSWSTARTSW
jgi:cytidyltransferase-like protein